MAFNSSFTCDKCKKTWPFNPSAQYVSADVQTDEAATPIQIRLSAVQNCMYSQTSTLPEQVWCAKCAVTHGIKVPYKHEALVAVGSADLPPVERLVMALRELGLAHLEDIPNGGN